MGEPPPITSPAAREGATTRNGRQAAGRAGKKLCYEVSSACFASAAASAVAPTERGGRSARARQRGARWGRRVGVAAVKRLARLLPQ